jgi:hypothetical protein
MRLIVIWGLWLSRIFLHLIEARSSGEKIERNGCFDFLYNFFLRRSLFQEELRQRNINSHMSSYKVLVNLSRL